MNADNLLTGMIAVELGLVTEPQLSECLQMQEGKLDPRPIGETLRERGYLTQGQLTRLLTEQSRRFDEFSETRIFGQVALYKGYVTPQKLGECIREQLRRRPGDDRPLIGEVMLRKGYLTLPRFTEIIATQGKALFRCPRCEAFQAHDSNVPLADAVCRRCGKLLQIVEDPGEITRDSNVRKGDTTVFVKIPLANLGKFEILSEVARGGMGIVFKAHDASLDRTVALKVLKEGDADANLIKRLHREGSIAAKLHHPNIVTIHEVGETAGLHYLCMDFIEGVDLLEHIRRGKLDRKRQLHLLETIARAVHYAHVRGVIHRDLKPSNILVDRGGNPIITDFGLAKSLDASATLTKEGSAMGTPFYMPPEQVLGQVDQIDSRSDIYSLGVVLYELLTGRPPFSGATVVEIYQKILSEEPPRPTTVDRTVDRDIEAICLKAMEKERELRYMSAEDLAVDLGRYLAGEPVLATRATGPRRLARKIRKNRGKLAAVAVVVAITLGATFVGLSIQKSRKVSALEREAGRDFDAGRWELAREAYKQIIALDEKNTEAARRVGVCEERLDAARREAHRQAEEGGKRRAEEEKARKMADARPYFDTGFRKYNEAVTLMHQPRLDPKLLAARFEEAAAEFGRAIDRDPDFADAYFLRGQCLSNLLRHTDAEADFTKAVEKSPNYGAAWFERGMIRMIRAFSEAGGFYQDPKTGGFTIRRAALGESPRVKQARLDFDRALSASSRSPRPDERFLIAAFISLADGRFKEALTNFSQSIAANEVSPEAHYGAGFAHLILGEYDLAIQRLSEAILLKPNLYSAYTLRGTAYVGKGDPEQAIREFENAVALMPHPGAYYNMGVLLGNTGRYPEALRALEKALEIEPDDLTMQMMRANCLFRMGKTKNAFQAYSAVIEKDDRQADAYKVAALCLVLQDEREKALAYFKRAAALDPGDDQNLSNWASTKFDLGDTQGAWETATQALERNPKNTHAIVVRAIVLRDRKDLPAALTEVDKALAIEPRYGKGHLHRGLILGLMERYEEALKELDRAVQLDPGVAPEAKFLIADIRKKMEKK